MAEPPGKSRGSGGGTPPPGARGQSPQKRPERNAELYKKHTAVLVSLQVFTSLVIVPNAVILAQEKPMQSGFEEFLILV